MHESPGLASVYRNPLIASAGCRDIYGLVMLGSPGLSSLTTESSHGRCGEVRNGAFILCLVIDIGKGEDKHERNFPKHLLYRIPGLCPVSSSPSVEGRHHHYYRAGRGIVP
jgi:hypothetical protein